MTTTHEVNFDGLVGPTHNYAGLSHGNLASMQHRGGVSRPREAALQGLAKMKALADFGVKQAVLPPHERPDLATLRALGFSGRPAEILRAAQKQVPALLAACCSASNMWVANAATVVPSRDSCDGRVHFTPANLISKLHRSIEPAQTRRTLRALFRDDRRFVVHPAVPAANGWGDEGAANHTRFAATHGNRGLHLFVYGHRVIGKSRVTGPDRFPSRQALESSEATVRNSRLPDDQVLFAQQHPTAIDAGVFHNDVISVGNENLFLYHENSFVNTAGVVRELRRRFALINAGAELETVRVPRDRVPLTEAVTSYFFNSQIVTVAPGRMALIAPAECREIPAVSDFIAELVSSGRTALRHAYFFDLRQSMRNGGGPACLRLRVVLTEAEIAAMPPRVFLNEQTHALLVGWVNKHYRETLTLADLGDAALWDESCVALDELTHLLGLGPIYPFQIDEAPRQSESRTS